jgi:uncharacterized protein (TIGR02466 family)|tara:strand:- start:545 stop:1168 length:624 start_codon:yes stop_codon:yes gene_type:complete
MITNRKILTYFPQPIFRYKVDNYKTFNKELEEYIYKLKKEDNEGVVRSNRGGWHSKSFKVREKGTIQNRFTQELSKYIFDVIQTYGWKCVPERVVVSEMWAIINKPRDFNVIHTHPNAYLSAAYYVKAPEKAGRFVIENPLSVARHSYPAHATKTEYNIKAAALDIEEGDLLLFPAYLPHKVNENKSDEDRIVISFNVNINNFDNTN